MADLTKLKHLTTKEAATPGFRNRILIAPISFFDTNGIKAPKEHPETPTNDVADITARDAIASPTTGDTAYVQSNGKYYEYDGSGWVEISPAVIFEDHVFKTNMGFIEIYNTPDKRTAESEHPDEDDTDGQIVTFNVSRPGISQDTIEMFEKLKTEELIVLAPRREGLPIQYGTLDEGATLKQTGTRPGGPGVEGSGLDYQIKVFQKNTILYAGAITKKS